MKALILSGGKGTRLRPITYINAKQLLPIANKPVLFYAIETIVSAGIVDIGIVVGDTFEQIKAAVGDGKRFGREVCITYIYQEKPLGLAHAVKIAQHFIGNSRFVLFLGDNFIEGSIHHLVEHFDAPDCLAHAQILLKSVLNPQDFGVAQLCYANGSPVAPNIYPPNENVYVLRVVEKPKEFISDLALVGIYFFDHNIFEAIYAIYPSYRGELEITDAIQYLINSHYIVSSHLLTDYWVDIGSMQNILEAHHAILSKVHRQIAENANVDRFSLLIGEVVVEEYAQVKNSIIYGPTIIGKHVLLENSYIGGFTSIGCYAKIVNSKVTNSIIMEKSYVYKIKEQVYNSLIGRNISIRQARTS